MKERLNLRKIEPFNLLGCFSDIWYKVSTKAVRTVFAK